jgi:Pyruvate/2-oxoacid:ferredoxin oxidoreductase gamma subunit
VNSPTPVESPGAVSADATATAAEAGSPRSENIVMLGFFTAAMATRGGVFTLDSIARAVREKFKGKDAVSSGLISLLESGYHLYEKDV